MDFAENLPLPAHLAKVHCPKQPEVMGLRTVQYTKFKVDFSPIAMKGVESVIASRIVALMKLTAPQILACANFT